MTGLEIFECILCGTRFEHTGDDEPRCPRCLKTWVRAVDDDDPNPVCNSTFG